MAELLSHPLHGDPELADVLYELPLSAPIALLVGATYRRQGRVRPCLDQCLDGFLERREQKPRVFSPCAVLRLRGEQAYRRRLQIGHVSLAGNRELDLVIEAQRDGVLPDRHDLAQMQGLQTCKLLCRA